MRGSPVWLASISRRSPLGDKPIATQLWPEQIRDEAEALLLRLLGPAGDPSRERLFRMQVTMCLHRALTQEEAGGLPAYFERDPATDLAGGPVEILRETEQGWETTKPCHHPSKVALDPRDMLLWFPADCGDCPPCLARAELQQRRDDATGAEPRYLDELLRSVRGG